MRWKTGLLPSEISSAKSKTFKIPEFHAVALICILTAVVACNPATESVQVGDDDIAGVVRGPDGPEAGVWVIAETFDLATRYAKIVVTDDHGRYLIPDLPDANYSVWVRGYGLVDSPKKETKPGSALNLDAVVAPDPHAAAQYYPAGYWFSLLNVPDKTNFPGTGPEGNGISPEIKNQEQLLRTIKSGTCLACHQMGSKGTREFQESMGEIESSVDAWERRLQSGQAGANMITTVSQLGKEAVLRMLADWTDRIADGEVPQAPPRPQGIERNVVITQWDWADPKSYLHDV
ncbi:MAG TPA: carboxypeptidase-like regulatory domain-containing protein, partial [Chryseosolibacter sp.]